MPRITKKPLPREKEKNWS